MPASASKEALANMSVALKPGIDLDAFYANLIVANDQLKAVAFGSPFEKTRTVTTDSELHYWYEEAYWIELGNFETGQKGLALKHDTNDPQVIVPSVAIPAIVTNIAIWKLDCLFYAHVVHFLALSLTMKPKKLDKFFVTNPNSDPPKHEVWIQSFNAPRLGVSVYYERDYDFGIMIRMRNFKPDPQYASLDDAAAVDAKIKAAKPSTIVVLSNQSPSAPGSYHFENCLKLGDDLFAAHPFTNTTGGNTFTLNEIKRKLAMEDPNIANETDETIITNYINANVFVHQILFITIDNVN